MPLSKRQQAIADMVSPRAHEREIDRRMQQLFAEERRKKDRELKHRMQRLGLLKENPLDADIRGRISRQPLRYRATLNKLYAAAIVNNETFFGGRLSIPTLVVTGRAADFDAHAFYDNTNGQSVIDYDGDSLEFLDFSDLLDVTLHEQLHQALSELCGGDKYEPNDNGWHHSRFQSLANRVARARGWPDCTVAESSQWPRRWKHWRRPHKRVA